MKTRRLQLVHDVPKMKAFENRNAAHLRCVSIGSAERFYLQAVRGRLESGNAMIYVLIVVALFAALSFILSRQSDTAEQSILVEEEANILSTQILQTANQIQQAVDQMVYSGTHTDDLDFLQPGETGFTTTPHTDKVFHPEGGGIIMPRLQDKAITEVNTNPAAGWYMGRFNNVEWTPSTGQDVIFTAHQIPESVCAAINEKLTGSEIIPTLTEDNNKVLIDDADHTGGPNADLDTTVCAACEGYPALCVLNSGGTIYSFYNVIRQQ